MKPSTRRALTKPYRLSEAGLNTLKKKLNDLHNLRVEYISRLRTLKEQQSDNLSIEDSGYIQTISALQFVDSQTQELEKVLASSTPLKPKRWRSKVVSLGSRVRLIGDRGPVEYTIVHSIEADPFNGKISSDSPLGRQLLGKRPEDRVVVDASPKRKPLSLKLVSIR